MVYLEEANLPRRNVEWRPPGGRGGTDGESVVSWDRASVWEDDAVETDNGESCTQCECA